MATGKTKGSGAELRALSKAGESLSRGDLDRVAGFYAQAARARERSGADPFPHYLKALDFYSAANRPQRGITLARTLVKRRGRTALEHRRAVRFRLAQMLDQTLRHIEAREEYQSVLAGVPSGDPLTQQARLGLAGAHLRLGDLEPLPGIIGSLIRDSQRADNLRVQASAMLLRALADHWAGDWFGALQSYDRVLRLVERRGLRSLAYSCCEGMAEVYLRLQMFQDARAYAARAHENTRSLHDPDASAAGALLYATALDSQALHLEASEGPGVAVGLRRESRRHLAAARKQFSGTDNAVRLTECWLEEQRLALRSTPRSAARAATVAARHARAAGTEDRVLLARALGLLSNGRKTTAAAWRQLARSAERSGASEIASAAWLAVSDSLTATGGDGRYTTASTDALARAFHWGVRRRPGMAATPLRGWMPGDARSAAIRLADISRQEEAEPKMASLEWTLAAASAKTAPGLDALSMTTGGGSSPAMHYSALAAAQLEDARRSGHWPPSPAQRAALKRARAAHFRSIEQDEIPTPSIPTLATAEALVVFAAQGSAVHTWVVRSPDKVLAHLETMPEKEWRTASDLLDGQLQDARGWPDSIIPETLVRSAQDALREVGTRIWTPLWPALQGAAQVLIVPDPQLPLLPFAALSLAAQPSKWPRPRAMTLLPNPGSKRPRRWRTPSGRAYAVATRDPVVPVAQRQAQGVVRILGGEVAATSSLRLDDKGERGELTRQLCKARLLHIAAPVYTIAHNPASSYVDLGDEPLPFWWLLRDHPALRLIVLPTCAPEGPDAPTLGRVVGAIGPQGAHRHGAPPGRTRSGIDLYGLSRFLLDGGIERVMLSAHPGDDTGPSVIASAFYAGLARGDSPSAALFLAQRNAWREELHPLLWSGFSCWGWP